MRLLKYEDARLTLTPDLYADDIPPYAILSHTWGSDEQEVDYHDMTNGSGTNKAGYDKLLFCAQQAVLDGLQYTWVDTCCINKDSSTELTEAINSMFRWYQDAVQCYVYLADVAATARRRTDVDFEDSRWFTRGWTLQELLAPTSVQFFTRDRKLLGDKIGLAQQIAEITGVPSKVLREGQFTAYDIEERISWSDKRRTKRAEDKAYSLLGIVGVQMPLIYGEGHDGALDRLKRKVKKVQHPPRGKAQTGNVHWVVSRTENKLFTGRADLIQRMQNAFHITEDDGSTYQTRLVITGLGGQGKSEVCIKFARLVREDFWGVFWVDVSNESTACNGFMAIARALGSPANSIEEHLSALANTTKPWLLILDNADDPTFDYTSYFPRGNIGAVIMTSRIVENSKHSTVPSEALEGLDLTLSAQLVLKAAHVPMEAWSTETKEAENVAELLGSHTLALVQAGAYIAGGHCRLNQYAERYRRHRKQLLQHHPNQHQLRYQNVLTTFEASVHAMHGLKSEAGMDALDLLRIFAMVHHTNFPRQLFYDAWVGAWAISHGEAQTTNTPHQQAGSQHTQRLLSIWKKSKRGIRLSKLLVRPKSYDIRALGSEHLSQLPSLLGHELVSWKYWNHRHVDDATALLVSLSLMERHEFDGDIRWSIHPIVHTWAKDRLQQSEKKHAWLQAACLCACSLVKSDIWKVQRMALRPHVRSLVSPGAEELFLYGPRALMLPLIVHCAWLLSAVGEFRALQTLLEGTYQAIGISPWSLAEEYMPLWHLASTASVVLSQPKLPIHLLQHITSVEAITLSESNPQRLSSQYNLARAYNDNGQPESAIPLLEHIVPLYKTLSTHQEWLVASQIELTRAYTATNRHYESMSLLEDAVKVQESYTGPSAQHCLVRAQAALGKAYVANGRISDAIDLLEHVMTINESMVDEPIQERLAIMTTLGCAYYEKDQYDKAVALLRNVEQDQKETLEDSDPYLVETQYTLATTYLVCGQAAEAVRIYEHVVKMHEIIMKETQPERLSAIYGLARAYKDIGEEDKALELMQRVVVLKRKTADEHDQVRVSSERFLKAWMEERELERLEEMVV